MKLNPIFLKDEITSARRLTLPALLTGVNGGLSILILMNLFYIAKSAKATGEIAYAGFLRIYYIAAVAEILLILIITPALTASSISAERERKTLDLLLTTQLDPWDIVVGKLMGTMGTLLLLVVTSIPILATVYIYGGITFVQIAIFFGFLICSALFCASVGIMVSSFISATTAATAVAYVIIFLSYFFMLGGFLFRESLEIQGGRLLAVVLAFMIAISIFMLYLSKRHITPHKRRKLREG
ncbi:ABC transporter permease [Oribacterium sp. WCC10]|uniref:ABC transporter permease n=1 Tax=Oribacterium sp. WCC10 TaxID=1855343 RepID=UPI0008E9B119|nr:ABC transporter permease subunit [Oribacterium sp. WCC10]SFG39859.1 ABC-2 family transporter protein [Oribacterium sp. WCC10]